jgi:hypothetical protein
MYLPGVFYGVGSTLSSKKRLVDLQEYGGFPKWGYPKMDGLMDDLGVPLIQETSIYCIVGNPKTNHKIGDG